MENFNLKKHSIFIIVTGVLFACHIIFYLFGKYSYGNTLCIHNSYYDKKSLGMSFIPDKNCYGYVFSGSDTVWFQSFNLGKRGELHIIIKDDHVSWLKGRRITLKEDKLADNYHQHFTNLMAGYKKNQESFDTYLELTAYTQNDFSGAKIMHFFNIDKKTEIPFYIACFFKAGYRDLNGIQCSVSFAYNSTVSVYVTVAYLDLKNARSKVREIQELITYLII
jgi:hypothetical protein